MTVTPDHLQSSSALVAVRVQSWAMSHGIGEDQIFVASLSRAVLKALAEYFRLVTCDGELAIVSRSMPGGNAIVLFVPPELPWTVAYDNNRRITDVSTSLLCRLLQRVRETRPGDQHNRTERRHADELPEWDFARDDFPLDAFLPARPETWKDRVWSYLVTLRPAPGNAFDRPAMSCASWERSALTCQQPMPA